MASDQDGARMQSDFQAFMLGKKSPKTPKEERHMSPKPSPSPKADANRKKLLRQCHQAVEAFVGLLQRDWLEVDDNLALVVQSIAHLRERCWKEATMLECEYETPTFKSPTNFLTKEDVELALAHDLKKHEKALIGLRKLLSSLQQAQEGLGRRLESIMLVSLEQDDVLSSSTQDEGTAKALSKMKACEELFPLLASELYRKQQYAEELFESANDEVLAFDCDLSDSPVGVARRIGVRWSRSHKKSPLHESSDLFQVLGV